MARPAKQRACFLQTLEYHLLTFCNVLAASVLIAFHSLTSTLASLSSTCTNGENICARTSHSKRTVADRTQGLRELQDSREPWSLYVT